MSKNKLKVLLVEDEPMIVEMYKIRLEEEGYEVATTDKGSEAISLAKELMPDIILLDVILPEMDGFSILKEIKSKSATQKIPILMLTNLSQEGDKKKGDEFGAVGYFIKSQHTPAEVIEEVKKILK